MRFVLLSTALVFTLASCTSKSPATDPIKQVGCSVEASLSTALSASIATALSCTGIADMQVDLLAALGQANLCAPPPVAAAPQVVKPQGIIGNVVCPLAVKSVMGVMAAKIPAKWNCSPNADAATLSTALSAACNKVVGI